MCRRDDRDEMEGMHVAKDMIPQICFDITI